MQTFFAQTNAISKKIKRIKLLKDESEKAHREVLVALDDGQVDKWETIAESIIQTFNSTALAIKDALTTLSTDNQALAAKAPRGSGDMRMRQLQVQHASLVLCSTHR